MTTLPEYLRLAFRNQHNMLDRAMADLTEEQHYWIPENTAANHIAFTIWHYVRTEDNVVQFILQDRKPTVWIEDGYHERFGLAKAAQGTGMSTEDARALRLSSLDDWQTYQAAVWEATDAYLAAVEPDALDRVHKVMPFGEIPAHQALNVTCLTHGHGHLGEICMLRVLQGLPSSLV